MQSSSPYDTNVSYQRAFSYHDQYAPKHGFFSTHRAFPIRASQPPHSSHTSHVLGQKENYLRRKTPNGIIDGAYDGSHTQLASQPPPLKHMILSGAASLSSTPAASTNYDYAVSGQAGWPRAPSIIDQSEPRGFSTPGMNLFPTGGTWHQGLDCSPHSAMALDCAPNAPSAAFYPYNNGLRVPTVVQPNYQQAPGPTIFNNGGLAPPPVWPEMHSHRLEATAFGIPSFQVANGQLLYPTMPLAASASRDYRHDRAPGNMQIPAQRLESLTLESRYGHHGAHSPDTSSPARFREKALVNAHRSYVDLLSYLHSSKKSTSNRSSSSSRSTSKMVIYPKVPNAPKLAPSTYSRRQSLGYGRSLAYNGSTTSYDLNSHGDGPDMSLVPPSIRHPTRSGNTSSAAYYHLLQDGSRYQTHDINRAMVTNSPVHNAKAAADMLHHLCEQSDWKWVDGMLLGGCLYYGLEKYEEALEWFKRILVVDNRSVSEPLHT